MQICSRPQPKRVACLPHQAAHGTSPSFSQLCLGVRIWRSTEKDVPNLTCYRWKQRRTCLGFGERLDLCRKFRRGTWKSASSALPSFTVMEPEVAHPAASWINTWLRRCSSIGKAEKITWHFCYMPAAVQNVQGDTGGPLHVSEAAKAKPCCCRRTGLLAEDSFPQGLSLLLLQDRATWAPTIVEATCGKAVNHIRR